MRIFKKATGRTIVQSLGTHCVCKSCSVSQDERSEVNYKVMWGGGYTLYLKPSGQTCCVNKLGMGKFQALGRQNLHSCFCSPLPPQDQTPKFDQQKSCLNYILVLWFSFIINLIWTVHVSQSAFNDILYFISALATCWHSYVLYNCLLACLKHVFTINKWCVHRIL